MFMLYAAVIGVTLGLVLGGRLERVGEVRLRWATIGLVALAVQVLLFSTPLTDVIGSVGPPIYLASMAAVLAVVLRNLHVRGALIMAVGAASNTAAIAANGGYMPASPEALAAAGMGLPSTYTNSGEFADVALAPLTDIIALPAWLPFTNVISVGDVLIGVGLIVAIVATMRDPRLDPRRTLEPALEPGAVASAAAPSATPGGAGGRAGAR